MWEGDIAPPPPETSNPKIDAKYEVQGRKLVLESNREKLQNFYEALRRPGYMDLQPFFQRRPRWTDEQKSRFIESFIINIPVPPLFLFEIKPNAYEVIDGQQRIRAIQDFFSDELELKGLVHWPELNGRKYSTLPSGVKAGIERRSISYSIVMRESAANEEEAAFIKRTVFERLNTGGAKMTAQEIRNSVFGGDFNRMIRQLSDETAFRAVWAPTYGTAKVKKQERNLVQGMIDVEQVLRFFAYRHAEHMSIAAGRFLDAYMFRSRQFDKATMKQLPKMFRETFALAVDLYGTKVFREYNPEKKKWGKVPRRAIADAELVALSDFLDDRDDLMRNRDAIVTATEKLFQKHPLKLLRGHGSGDAVRTRIALFKALYKQLSKVG
jgi:hypothetical protein